MKKAFTLFFLIFSCFCFTNETDSFLGEERFSFISFATLVNEDTVIISWKASHPNKNIVIYRSHKRFASFMSLSEATPIANLKDTGEPYFDRPVAGTPFYYAIAEESQIASGKINFIGGKNTTAYPLAVKASANRPLKQNTEVRAMPLPFLNLKQASQKKKKVFSSQTEKLINALIANQENYQELDEAAKKRKPYIFPDDKREPKGGETMELQRILKENFLRQNWAASEKELKDFLKIRRTTRVTARTNFYLGETLFFQNKYEEALLKFLNTESSYPTQSKEWVRYCLAEIASF